MNAFFSSKSGRIFLIIAALVFAAILVLLFLAVRPKPAAAPLGQNSRAPEVLSESDVQLRSEAAPEVVAPAPQLVSPVAAKEVKARSFLVYDVTSGSNLAERNPDFPLPIASLTKLMTGYVAYKNLNLSQETVTISESDVFNVSPVLGLKPGDQVKAIDLFDSMLIGSANDAALTLGNYVSRKLNLPFEDLMNQEAVALGMKDSHFNNSLGFDSETNYSTANDLKILVKAVEQYQAFALVGRQRLYNFTSDLGNAYHIKTTNSLLAGDSEISAIKTGFTDEAQGAMITQINHEGHKFVIIVLNSPDREEDTLKLKRAIISSYRWP